MAGRWWNGEGIHVLKLLGLGFHFGNFLVGVVLVLARDRHEAERARNEQRYQEFIEHGTGQRGERWMSGKYCGGKSMEG